MICHIRPGIEGSRGYNSENEGVLDLQATAEYSIHSA